MSSLALSSTSNVAQNPFAEGERPRSASAPPSPPPPAKVVANPTAEVKDGQRSSQQERDLDKEYALDAIVTYRHLLGAQSLGPANPLRVIAHCDVDAAYAQFEAKRLGLDNSVPIAVQQWQGLIAVNYAARAFGITRHENVQQAKKLCPELICCHVATLKDGEDEPRYHEKPSMYNHKVSLEPYRRESQKMIKVFQQQCPDAEIEKASIDECFFDLSLPVRKLLLVRYPHLAAVPPDAPLGLDTPLPSAPPLDWNSVDWGIVPRSSEVAAASKASRSQDHHEEGALIAAQDKDMVSQGHGWADVALWLGGELMEGIRKAVEDSLGYTTSAGIAHNKALSKLCSAFKKPRAQTVLRTSAVAAFLRPIQFQKIRFLGGKLGDVMAAEYGAVTVGDMLFVPLDEMQTRFGEESLWVYNILRGVDYSEVKPKSLVKSMLASKNMRPPISSVAQAASWLRMLSVDLIGRLKEAREAEALDEDGQGGVWPKTLTLSYREVGQQSRSKQIPFPFHRDLNPDGVILKLATRLLSEVLPAEVKPGVKHIKLSNLGLGLSALERLEEGQRGIESFFKAGQPSGASGTKRKAPAQAESSDEEADIEVVEQKKGLDAFFKPTSSSSIGPPPEEASSSTSKTSSPVRKRIKKSPAPRATVSPSSATSWMCPKCRKKLPLLVIDDAAEDDRNWIAAENDRVRMEHEDWHVALSLQEEPVEDVQRANVAESRKVKVKKDGKGKAAKGSGVGGLGGWLMKK